MALFEIDTPGPFTDTTGVRSVLVLVLLCWATPASADWTDVPALISEAVGRVDGDLRACAARLPKRIAITVTRTRDGTRATMPMPQLGGRGPTPEERCLLAAVAKISLPALPTELDRVVLGYTIGEPPADEPAFAAWRDPVAAVAKLVGDGSALAACDGRPRTVRIVLDLRRGATRAWLPAWQFRDEARVRACLAKVLRTWQPPPLPRAMGELQLAIRTAPRPRA